MTVTKLLNHMNALVLACLINWMASGTVYFFACHLEWNALNVVMYYMLWLLYNNFVFIFYFWLSVLTDFTTKKWLLLLMAVVPAFAAVFAFHCFLLSDSVEPDIYILLFFSAWIPLLVSVLEKRLV